MLQGIVGVVVKEISWLNRKPEPMVEGVKSISK